MPLPTPRTDEKKDDFIGRCMADATMTKDFPDQKQRLAVCYKQARGEGARIAQAAAPTRIHFGASVDFTAEDRGDAE